MKDVYQHMKTNEIVFKEDAEAFALDQLGLTIKPLDKHGAYTQLQIDFLGEFTEWYFSDMWVKEKVKEEE